MVWCVESNATHTRAYRAGPWDSAVCDSVHRGASPGVGHARTCAITTVNLLYQPAGAHPVRRMATVVAVGRTGRCAPPEPSLRPRGEARAVDERVGARGPVQVECT